MTPINTVFTGTGPLFLFLAKATVLLVAAVLAMIPLRRGTAGARHLVWLAALVGVLALPLLSRVQWLHVNVLPSSLASLPLARELAVPEIPLAPPTDAPEPSVITISSGTPTVVTVVRTPPAAPLVVGTPAGEIAPPTMAMLADAPRASTILTVIAVIWGAIALALVGWLVAGTIFVRRIVSRGRELTSPDWTMPLCEVADRLDLELPPRLVISDRIEMAFACRALSPTIVLPAAAESWSDDRRRAVLFHELAHVKRHDLLGHTLGRLACALYWFHPLVWTAAKNLRAESERACDDLVLSCGARPSEYAQHLLDMVTSVRHHGAPVMALPMARKKEFEGRMLAILDPGIRRASPGRLQSAGVIAAIALLSVTIAAVSPATAAPVPAIAAEDLPTPAPTPTPTVAVQQASTRSESQTGQPHLQETLNDFVAQITHVVGDATGAGLQRASRELARQLRSQQPGDTSRAALLIRILGSDSDASVRRTAAWGLNDMDTPSVPAALIRALKQDADASVREMAAWSLADHPNDEATAALADALLHDSSAHVRGTAAWAIGNNDGRKQSSALESALADKDSHVRFTAIWAIGQSDLRSAPNGLTNSLTDASSQVRLVTAWALGEIEDKATAPAIVKAFQTETDSEVRAAELRALAAMDQASPELIETALKSSDPELRRRAVGMLAGSDSGVWPWPWPWPQPRPSP
jgi:Antirepressor regulating drug resistance, predicted signal transduction N-terminal membrane component